MTSTDIIVRANTSLVTAAVRDATVDTDSRSVTWDDETRDLVTAAYDAADTKGKAALRKIVKDGADTAVRNLDGVTAFTYKALAALLVAPSAKPEVDLVQVVAERVVALQLAATAITSGKAFPVDGVPADQVTERVLAMLADSGKTIPESVYESAAKIALAKISTGTKAAGGDIAAHIQQALAILGRPAKVSEIANVHTEAYPNGAPSDGAVSVRLFPTKGDCTVPGVVPTLVDGRKGARLA